MKNRLFIGSLSSLSLSMLLLSCSHPSDQEATPALFNTRSEAEKAAKKFNCSGAHKMGTKWMPCERHSDHKGHHNH